MADTIKLPPLPEPTLIADTPSGHTAAYSPSQLRAHRIAVAQAVLEAAAKELEASSPNLKRSMDRSLMLGAAIIVRSLTIEGEA